ncbi:MAG: 50S ribosomal protein L30 [Promethearchaeati archaeon SRVP18_Atabeyarchaeia-1]
MSEAGPRLLVLRLRGDVDVRDEIRQTLKMLKLHKVNHATLVEHSESYLGMLQKVKDYATWGEVSVATLEKLLVKRGRVAGNEPLNDKYVTSNSKFGSVKKFTEALATSKASVKDLRGLKPVFRLHPPRGGFDWKKKHSFKEGGELGYRGKDINRLLEKMI